MSYSLTAVPKGSNRAIIDKAINRLEYMLKMESGSIALGPMPSFLWVFTEEQRSQIINYIVDEENGITSNSN